MPLMYHEDASEPVSVADGCVSTMLNRGWTLDKSQGDQEETPETEEQTATEE